MANCDVRFIPSGSLRPGPGQVPGPNGYQHRGTRLTASAGAGVVDTGQRKEVNPMLREIVKFIVSVVTLVGALVGVVRQGRVIGLWS